MSSLELLSRKIVHQALKTWHNARRLGELPLVHLKIVETHRQQNGYQATDTGRGLALRETLQRAVETLKPDGEPDPLEKRWRPYLLLTERYLNGRSPEYIIEFLTVARSTFDHTQTEALETLADLLRQWEQTASLASTNALPNRKAALPSLEGITFPALPPPFLAPPRPAYALIGRNTVFAQLKTHLLSEHHPVALSGLPGVGKTALAVALTHDSDLRARYPDGVLWIALGNHPNLLALLGTWGTALGLSPDELGKLPDLDTRARAIHAAIGLRRILIVIDDVWNNADALVFSLGGPNCAALLTTRLPKVALDFAGENSHPIPELSDEDGLTLLAEFAPQVITAEPDAARALVHAAGGLPLALTLIGRHLRQETHTGLPRRLRAALERLQTTETRLHLTQPASPLDHQPSLSAELPLSLLTIIAISTEALEESSRRAFHTLSVFPPKPNTFSEEAAIVICSSVTPAPLISLDILIDCGLLEYILPDRYTLHPIIAEFARLELAEEPTTETHAAQRLAQYFLLTPDASDSNLDADAENILAALHAAHVHGMDHELIQGANTFCAYWEARGLYTLAEEHLTRAEAVARAMVVARGARPHPDQLLHTLNNLGRVAQRRGDYVRAETHYREALALSRLGTEFPTQSAVLQGLGLVALSRGDFSQAGTHLQKSLAVAHAVGDSTQISAVLSNLGALHFNLGEYDQAGQLFEDGLKLAREAGLKQQSNALLTNLGVLYARRGDFVQARTCFEEALELARKMGQRSHTSYLLTNLGTLASEQGEHQKAVAYFQEGLKLARDMGQRERVGHLLANLGALATDEKDFALAQVYLDESLALSREIGHRQNTIFALANLGGLQIAIGDFATAATLLEEGLSLARETGQLGYVSAILLEYGRYYSKQADWQDAERAYQEGLTLARKMGALASVGRALFGLAQVAAARGNLTEADQLAQESLNTYQAIGHYREKRVRDWLSQIKVK